MLAEPQWNRGLMSEAVRAVLAWALEQWPDVQRIVSRAVAENAASLRVMARCGLEFQRVCEANWPKLETPVRQHEYAASREVLGAGLGGTASGRARVAGVGRQRVRWLRGCRPGGDAGETARARRSGHPGLTSQVSAVPGSR